MQSNTEWTTTRHKNKLCRLFTSVRTCTARLRLCRAQQCTPVYVLMQKTVSCTRQIAKKRLLITEPTLCLKKANQPKPILPYGYAAPSIVLQSPKKGWLSCRILSSANLNEHLLPADLHSCCILTNIINIQRSCKSFHLSTFTAASAGGLADAHTCQGHNTQAEPNSSAHAQGASAHTCHCSRVLHAHGRRQPLALFAHTLVALTL